MKILHELNQLEKGGAERVVAGIIRHDHENEHTVYTYKDGPMRPVLEAAGARVIVEDPQNVQNVDAEIIHVHTGGDVSRIAEQVQNMIPTIETVHSPVVSANRDAWIKARVGVSNVVTKRNRKCRTIYNGIDLARLERSPYSEIAQEITNVESRSVDVVYRTIREKLGIPKDAFVDGRLGRIAPEKCLEDFILACWYAKKTGLIPNLHVLIVGDEAPYARCYLARMKVMAASLPLENVHFHPAVEEIGWALAGMGLFLYPSPEEGFGLVYLEAMAAGVPVVAWENDLTTEILRSGAILALPGIQPLAEAVSYLAINKGVRDMYAKLGYEQARTFFSEEIMSLQYQELYREVLQSAPAGASNG